MKHTFYFLAFLFLISIYPQDRNAVSEIKNKSLLKTVSILSSKEYDERLPGSEGYDKAEKYAANKFLESKPKPLGNAGYFQLMNVGYNRIDTPAVFNIILFSISKQILVTGQ